jgi:Kef-type K+ transport system membrane component KefB
MPATASKEDPMTFPEAFSALQARGGPGPLVLVTLVIVVGALAGEWIARTTRLPRIVGYTGAGCVAAVAGMGVPMPLAGVPRLVVDLALALLLFEIGSRVRLLWLRQNPGLLATSLAEAVLGGSAVIGALLAMGVPAATACGCAVLAIPASVAVAGRVAHELGAHGQVTQRMALLTALNTLYAVLALTALKLWGLAGQDAGVGAALLALGQSFLGSLALAAALAACVALVARRLDLRNESAVLLLLGLIMLAVSTARWLGLSTLLVPLLAGLLLRNATQRPWVWPRHFGTAGGVLVLMLFVVVGASWSPQVLATGGAAALALLAARGLAKTFAVMVLSRWARLSARQGLALSVTLTPLSATALVMLSELMETVPELGRGVAPIVLAAVAMLELAGPVAVQLALRMAGELDRAAAPSHKEPQ